MTSGLGAASAAPILDEDALMAMKSIYGAYFDSYVARGRERAWWKAFALLWADLTPKQKQDFVVHRSFTVMGRPVTYGGGTYGCIGLADDVPLPDKALAMKRWIEADLQEVMNVTNSSRSTRPIRQKELAMAGLPLPPEMTNCTCFHCREQRGELDQPF